MHNLFYVPAKNISGSQISIGGHESHHIKDVLRKKQNDIINITDGAGNHYLVKLAIVGKKAINGQILEKRHFEPGNTINLSLAFVPIKSTRNDLIIEKGTELGIGRFLLFASRYSVIKGLNISKFERLRKVAIAAMLQSQRFYLPEIRFHHNLDDLLHDFRNYELILLADKTGRQEVSPGAKSILFVVGPEGGFDECETNLLTHDGAIPLSLGPSRLRSETAAICGAVKILSAYRAL